MPSATPGMSSTTRLLRCLACCLRLHAQDQPSHWLFSGLSSGFRGIHASPRYPFSFRGFTPILDTGGLTWTFPGGLLPSRRKTISSFPHGQSTPKASPRFPRGIRGLLGNPACLGCLREASKVFAKISMARCGLLCVKPITIHYSPIALTQWPATNLRPRTCPRSQLPDCSTARFPA